MSAKAEPIMAETPTTAAARRGPPKFHKNPFVWAAIAGMIALPMVRPLFRHEPKPPPVLWQIPSFSLTDHDGKAAGSDTLRGKVYVVGFFFTNCRSICPKLMEAKKSLQKRYKQWKADVHLVSITIDPENDTPAVLRAYAKKLGADLSSWTFLTGKDKAIRDLINKGFKSHVGPKTMKNGVLDIAHTGNLALVDHKGRLRGTYRTDKEGLDEVFHRSQHVLLERRKTRR
jgi:protein SCO1/2